jgi:hypothetical protein
MGFPRSLARFRRLALLMLAMAFLFVRAGPLCANPGVAVTAVSASAQPVDCHGAPPQKKTSTTRGDAAPCAPSCAALTVLRIAEPAVIAPPAPPPVPAHAATLLAWNAGPSPPPPRTA